MELKVLRNKKKLKDFEELEIFKILLTKEGVVKFKRKIKFGA
jgi:hypothetical protein